MGRRKKVKTEKLEVLVEPESMSACLEVKNTSLFKQCFTFVSEKGHTTMTLRPGEVAVIEGTEWVNLKYYINNKILKVSHGNIQ